jgi:hypothetical protein
MIYRKCAGGCNPSTQEVYKRTPKGLEKTRRKSKKEITRGASQAAIQVNKVEREM